MDMQGHNTVSGAERGMRDDIETLTDAQFRALVMTRFDAGSDRMNAMESLIADNTATTNDTKKLAEDIGRDTKLIREYLAAGRTTVRVLSFVGKGLRNVYLWVTSAVGLYAILRGSSAHHAALPTDLLPK